MTSKDKKDIDVKTQVLLKFLEQIQSGDLSVDKKGNITSISSLAAKYYGFQSEVLINQSISHLFSKTWVSEKGNKNDLEKERNQLQNYLDVALTIFIVLDSDGNIISLNQRGLDVLGYEEEEVIGKNLVDLIVPPKIREKVRAYFDQTLREKVISKDYHDTPALTKSGETRIIHWHNSLILDEYGEVLKTISSGVDVTYLKNVESELRQLNLELENRVKKRTSELQKAAINISDSKRKLEVQIQEVKATRIALMNTTKDLTRSLEKEMELNNIKSRFVSMASHEFRTPLSTILSSAAIIDKYTLSEQQAKRERHIKKIKSSVSNLNGILNDFLSAGRLEEGKVDCHIEMTPILDLCMETVDQVDGLLKPGQVINFIGLSAEASFPMDKQIIKNCLFNLLTNAIKYSQEDKEITLLIEKDSSHLVFKVIDRGIGIPKADQKYLFSRFFRAENVTNIKGTGLGLSIVKEYLALMNGTISFKSKLGFGSTFEIILPLNP